MDNARKYIWSAYFILWVYFIFFDSSYEQEDHILLYLTLGWIPFSILHFIWKKSQPSSSTFLPGKGADNSFDERFKLVLKIVDKKEILDTVSNLDNATAVVDQINSELEELYKKTGKNEEFFEKNVLDLDLETIKKYLELKDKWMEFNLYKTIFSREMDALEELNRDLEEGLGLKEAKKRMTKQKGKNAKEIAKLNVQLELSKAIAQELIEVKRKYGDNYKEAKIEGDKIIQRVYEKHPEWKSIKT